MSDQPHSAEVELGSRLRELRLTLRLSQAELADRANISLGAIKSLESGRGSTVRTLSRVLKALGHADWVDRVVPSVPTFNPLDLVDRRARRPMRRRAPRRRAT